jgi:streptogramin lyase
MGQGRVCPAIVLICVCGTIAHAASDRVIVGTAFDQQLRAYSMTGALVGQGVYGGSCAQDMALGPDGALWVADFNYGLRRHDVTTLALLSVVAPPHSASLSTARGLIFLPNGKLIVSSQNGNGGDLRMFNSSTGAYLGIFANSSHFDVPRGLALGPDGNLYVADGYAKEVEKFSQNGTYLGSIYDSSLRYAMDVAFGPDGSLLVADIWNDGAQDRIVRYNPITGALLGTLIGPGGIDAPYNIAMGPDGALWEADLFTDHIKRFNVTTGAFLGDFATVSGGPTSFVFVPEPAGFVVVAACAAILATRRRGRL